MACTEKSKGRRPGASRDLVSRAPQVIPDRSRPISSAHHLSVGATAQSSEQLHSIISQSSPENLCIIQKVSKNILRC
jgi:hypothetical protein